MTIEEFATYCKTTIAAGEEKLKSLGEGALYFETKDKKGKAREHLYFTMLSNILTHPTNRPMNIVEIGTGFGESTVLMSKLWPEAKIYTIDVPDDHPMIDDALRRKGKPERARFEEATHRKNVDYIAKDSFYLPSLALPGECDLVYVDGWHNFPVCAWDMCWAYHKVGPGGFMLMDDYGADGHVTPCLEYIRKIIPEKINLLPWSAYNRNKRFAWLRKGEK